MAKTLELTFHTDSGKTAKLSIDNPKEPIDTLAVKQAMDQIIAANVFTSPSGLFVSAKEARVIERNVVSYEIV